MSGPNGERFQLVWWWRARWYKPWFFHGGAYPLEGPNRGRIYRDRFGFWMLEVRIWG